MNWVVRYIEIGINLCWQNIYLFSKAHVKQSSLYSWGNYKTSQFNLHSPGILNPDHPPAAEVKAVRVERIVGAGGVQQQSLETEMGIIICTKLDFVNFQSAYLDRSSTTYSVLGLAEKVS